MKSLVNNKVIKFGIGGFFILVLIFGRSFMGIYIFGMRIGELSMGLSLLILIFSLLFYKKIEVFDKILDKRTINIFSLLVLSFVFIAIYSNSSFINPYTYRASSYIWTLGFLFLGIVYFENNKLNKLYVYSFLPILLYIYFFSIYGLPQGAINFILSISDKFEPHKGSDLLLMYLCIFLIFNRYEINKRIALEVFVLFSSLYFPLMLFKSRASFIGFILFLIFEIYYLRGHFRGNLKRNILLFLLAVFILFQSVFLVAGSGFLKISKTEEEVKYIATYRADPDEEIFRLFYIAEDELGTKTTRIFSTDNNLNWRLQIWQDVAYDIHHKNLYFTGYGFSNKIPAMELETRQGLDKLNENVHNYIVTIFARGGLVTLFLVALMYINLVKRNILFSEVSYIYVFLLPLLFNSLFDVAMENAHFPLLFYFIFGMLFHKKKIFPNY